MRGLWGENPCTKTERIRVELDNLREELSLEHAIVVPLSLPEQSLSKYAAQLIKLAEGVEIVPYCNVRPRVLIGQDNWHLIATRELREINKGLAISRTSLGWVAHGYEGESDNTYSATVDDSRCDSEGLHDERLDELMMQFIELENVCVSESSLRKSMLTNANKILEETTRKVGKQWETGLIWNDKPPPEVDSKRTALKRLFNLEKKLDRDSTYANLYYAEMQRFFDCGYAEKVDPRDNVTREWFLPHFGVTNVNKPGKVRLVFDAAAKTRGISFNDQLEAGPSLLESLVGVLLRFRQEKYAVQSDIQDMFLRVGIREADRGSQRFLWRGRDRNRNPDVFVMKCLIFGSKSSPTSAIYVKNKNAERFVKTKPDAAKSIEKNTYMDDYLASRANLSDIQNLVRDVTLINGEANFIMRKWASNDSRAIESVRAENHAKQQDNSNLCSKEDRVLGLFWNRSTDELGFNVGFHKIPNELVRGSVKPTKRQVVSIVMSVFDPLGLLSPYIMRAKLLMQKIWRSGIAWDEQLRDDENVSWLAWLNNLKQVGDCRIARCYKPLEEKVVKIQMHTFCDASEQACAAVVYLRTEFETGRVIVSLVMAKTRVAPKMITIPRMELNAALLGARLAHAVIKELEVTVDERFFHSDSTTVLHWIRDGWTNKQAYIARRLSDIGELTRISEWRWVPSKLNVADDATRDSVEPMRKSDRWFTGPTFLYERESEWPPERPLTGTEKKELEICEVRKKHVPFVAIVDGNVELPGLIRWYGWNGCLELAVRLKLRVERTLLKKQSRSAIVEDYEQAEKFIFLQAQAACFSQELDDLIHGRKLKPASKLISLMPFIDEDGLLRARGRVTKVDGNTFENSPIILDATHFAIKLFIKFYHRRHNHETNEKIVNELRQKYYIIGLRSRLRWIAKKCLICRARRAQPINPQMANLPIARVAYGLRPFTHCGIDYWGPMTVKIGRRQEKRWGVLFTCMTIRAVHLELASDLSANSTIMAMNRMANRRGSPTYMYSDCGTNFVAASKELKEAIAEIDREALLRYATQKQIKWRFNSPMSPHAGGAWERMVRSVKLALGEALYDQSIREDVLATVLCEAEHSVNSRPLTHVSVDPRDEEALTPNHFLIGASSGAIKFEHIEAEMRNFRKSYEIVQNLANRFWKRWLHEYLPTLLPRKKWQAPTPTLQIGDYVLIIDYSAPRNSWKTGKVVEVFPSKEDGIIRNVKIRTPSKEYTRHVNRLVRILGCDEVQE